jgi:hypothetical protein
MVFGYYDLEDMKERDGMIMNIKARNEINDELDGPIVGFIYSPYFQENNYSLH